VRIAHVTSHLIILPLQCDLKLSFKHRFVACLGRLPTNAAEACTFFVRRPCRMFGFRITRALHAI